ncbi:DUF5319 domain-containing protein [soil metagenome]
MSDDAPLDPFLDDPSDPAQALADDEVHEPLSPDEREDALTDLEDLDVFRALLEPGGVRGVVMDCGDCGDAHYVSWDLMRANLRHLLDAGLPRVHEPPYDPDPHDYVTWEYARGYADGVMHASDVPDRD